MAFGTKITQFVVEWFNHITNAGAAATQISVEVGVSSLNDIFATQQCVEVGVHPPSQLAVTQICVEVGLHAPSPTPAPTPSGEPGPRPEAPLCILNPAPAISPDLIMQREPNERSE